jgi:hypothetical protein
MKTNFWQALQHADWETVAGTAGGGALSLFIWHILQSGEFGAETAPMHVLGVSLITLGWACLALAVYLLYRSVATQRAISSL